MEVLIIAVYAVVNIICYLSDRADAQSMNKKLLEMKKNKKEWATDIILKRKRDI